MDEKTSEQPRAPKLVAFNLQHIGPEKDMRYPLRSGDLCPNCRAARLDYDGLLNLACPQCRYTLGGCFS